MLQGGAADTSGPASTQPSHPQSTQAAPDTATNSEAGDCTPAADDKSSPASASSQAANSERGVPAGSVSAQSPGDGSQPSQHPALRVSDRGAVSQLSDMSPGTSEAFPVTEMQVAAHVSASPSARGRQPGRQHGRQPGSSTGQPGGRPEDQSGAAQGERSAAVPFRFLEQVSFLVLHGVGINAGVVLVSVPPWCPYRCLHSGVIGAGAVLVSVPASVPV